MGKEQDDLYDALFRTIAKPSGGLNNLRALADLGTTIPSPSATPSANLFSGLSGFLSGSRTLGDPIFGYPAPVVDKPSPPPAPAVPDLDFIRRFVGAMVRKRVLVKDGRVLPSIDDLAIMEGRRVKAAFVYSDLHGFTKLVATQPENKSFIFLDTFVDVASRLTKHYVGQVVDCAGDRVLSVFHRPPGDLSSEPVEDAVTFALFLQTAFYRVIGPSFAAGLGQLSLGIGIDYGEAVVGCVGIRGGKKIVFFGEAANNAAKLQEMTGAGETILSYAADIRKPAYITNSPGWNDLRRERLGDGSTILRTTNIFASDRMAKAR